MEGESPTLNTETSVATNLKPFNCVSKTITLFLTIDSASLSSGSGLKKLKIPKLYELASSLKALVYLAIFAFIFWSKNFQFFLFLYIKDPFRQSLLGKTFQSVL